MFASGGVNHGIQQVRSDAVAVHHRCAVNHHVHALGCQGVKAGVTDGGGDDGFAGQFFQSEFIKRVRRCHTTLAFCMALRSKNRVYSFTGPARLMAEVRLPQYLISRVAWARLPLVPRRRR